MRLIATARLDKVRPVLVLTRPGASQRFTWVSIAPITSTIRGLSPEVPLDARNGLDHPCVVNCDAIQTIPVADLGDTIGMFFDDQEPALARAIHDTFNLSEA